MHFLFTYSQNVIKRPIKCDHIEKSKLIFNSWIPQVNNVHMLLILFDISFWSASDMDLATAIEETTVALNLFLNNRFTESKTRMEPW